jgi:hypothetical protein
VGLTPSDVEEAIGMPFAVHVPSSRDVTLSVNQGYPQKTRTRDEDPADTQRYRASGRQVSDPVYDVRLRIQRRLTARPLRLVRRHGFTAPGSSR